MDGAESNTGQLGPAERSHRSSVSSVGARGKSLPFFISSVPFLVPALETWLSFVFFFFFFSQQVNVIVSRKYDVLRCGKLTERT